MLINNWRMNYLEHQGLECQVPCSMYGVLLEHGLTDDPFYGINEQAATELSRNDCRFETDIEVDNELLAKQFVELTFYGLDTMCDIILNGHRLDSVQNMFRTYSYQVKDKLFVGTNRLELHFKAPIPYFEAAEARHKVTDVVGTNTVPGAPHLRKALYMSGWDWGPRLPDMGIYRKVELRGYDTDRIDNTAVLQHHHDGAVELEVAVSTKHGSDCDIYVTVDGKCVKAVDGVARITVDDPRLWWPRGYGDQPLYEVVCELKQGDTVIDRDSQTIGLRTITVSAKEDALGKEFCFVVNGVRIFIMGANYVPQDNLLGRISPERTEELIKQCLDANYNCLRVWGGGYYPEDEFYDLCDRYGLLVWQDFMAACHKILLTSEYEREFVAEAECNLIRLRNHASLAILCGNNEIESMLDRNDLLAVADYLRMFEHLLPEVCLRLAPQTFYWKSSPSSNGGFNDPDNKLKGDSHYWEVWHSNAPFEEYRKHTFRFCSEFGFESYPSIKTVREFAAEKDMNCFSRVMENHQKCFGGNKKILAYIADYYLYPSDFEKLVYTSQLLQADAIKYGVEHFRRQRGICMGAIYWQVNDCWPVASWSSIDYYGRYKALHYAAKKFFAPVAIGLFVEGDTVTVNLSNETMSGFDGRLVLSFRANDGSELERIDSPVKVGSLSSTDVMTADIRLTDKHSQFICAELYTEQGELVMRQTALTVPPKHFDWLSPSIKLEFADCDGGVMITATSDVFAKGVFIDFDGIDCNLSDNFFDLTDSTGYTVIAKGDFTAEQLRECALVTSVYDIDK